MKHDKTDLKKADDELVADITKNRSPSYLARRNDYTAVLDVLNGPATVRHRALDRFRTGATTSPATRYAFGAYAPTACPFYVTPKTGMTLEAFAAYVAAGIWEPLVADVHDDAAAAFASHRIRFNYPDSDGAEQWRAWAETARLEAFAHSVLLALLRCGRSMGQLAKEDPAAPSRIVCVEGVDLTNWRIHPSASGPVTRSVTWRRRVDHVQNAGDVSGLYADCRVGSSKDHGEYWWSRLDLDGDSVQILKEDGEWRQTEIPLGDVGVLPVEIFDLHAIDAPARPPMADAAWLNLALLELSCEGRMLIDLCAPVTAVSGSKPSEIGSANTIWTLDNVAARLQGNDPGTGTLEAVAQMMEVIRANISSQMSDLRQYGEASGVALSIEAFHRMARPRAIAACAVEGINRLLDLAAELDALPEDGKPVAEMPLGMDAPTGFSAETTLEGLREAVRDGQLPASVIVRYMEATEQLPEDELETAKAFAIYQQARQLKEDGELADHEARRLGLATLGEAGKMFPLLKTEPAEDPIEAIQLQEGGKVYLDEAAAAFGVSAASTTLSRRIKARVVELVKKAGGAAPKWVKESGNRDVLQVVTIGGGSELHEIAYYRPGRKRKGEKQEGRRFVGIAINPGGGMAP